MMFRPITEQDAWPSAQALTSCAKSATRPSASAEIDGDAGAAQPRMRAGAGLRRGQPAQSRDIGREFENFPIVDVVEHGVSQGARPATS